PRTRRRATRRPRSRGGRDERRLDGAHPRAEVPALPALERKTVNGPATTWYLALAAFLFGIGALGVLVRRNPLIVLLSLELMLNGGNLALIAVSRHFANGAGQIFGLAVMAIAASEVCVGLGLVVAIN